MVYNMGTNDHPIGEIGVKVNDNAYHVVRFTRSGANSTIQVDDYNVQTNHPEGNNFSSHVCKISHVIYICSVQAEIVKYDIWENFLSLLPFCLDNQEFKENTQILHSHCIHF